MNDFEVKKRGKCICEGGTTRIRLPCSFLSKFLSERGCDINTAIQQHYSLDEINVLRNKYLCLEPKVMKQLFNPVLNDIISHLSNLLAKPELSEVKFVFLVGGFSDSAVLQERIKGHFGHAYRILIPHCASITDPEVRKAPGRGLVIETPEAWKTKDIEIHLLFGGTEIKVTAVNRASNRKSTVHLDFLTSN